MSTFSTNERDLQERLYDLWIEPWQHGIDARTPHKLLSDFLTEEERPPENRNAFEERAISLAARSLARGTDATLVANGVSASLAPFWWSHLATSPETTASMEKEARAEGF